MLAKFLLVAYALVAPSLGSRLPYIIGGTTVTDATKYPWQVSIKSQLGSHSCGAALISNTWVVTAAHCISGTSHEMRFGTVTHAYGGVERNSSKIIVHENWGDTSPGSFPNDIAVIQFPAVTLSDTIKPITIGSTAQTKSTDCYITGWGYTTTGVVGGNIPEYLQQAKINVCSKSECEKIYGSQINDGHVCIGGNDKGACKGDSGGPLVCGDQLIGVTSWGFPGCYPIFPSVYTRLSYFRSWIRRETGV